MRSMRDRNFFVSWVHVYIWMVLWLKKVFTILRPSCSHISRALSPLLFITSSPYLPTTLLSISRPTLAFKSPIIIISCLAGTFSINSLSSSQKLSFSVSGALSFGP
uniref:Uncharacterized protein n=1 Tax=Panstrongylus lignarius TaxID=156445 RepID=A0A224Y177_9HEMI